MENQSVDQHAVYQMIGQMNDPNNAQFMLNDLSVISGPESSTGKQGYNTANIVKQRGLNNMSQIVATNTSTQLAGGPPHQGAQKYKNGNTPLGYNTK